MLIYMQNVFSSKFLGIDHIEYEYTVDAKGDIEIITENIPFKYLSTELQYLLIAHATLDLDDRREHAAANI